ncbi:VWA domain-containing protein [Nibricoccus sp. IMCC34717]|uniref:VWA domain-containing protein n=1 Tax=Nibricoccus sp. IMCC34717 TaxID=3034021 RepID=UPI00384F4601
MTLPSLPSLLAALPWPGPWVLAGEWRLQSPAFLALLVLLPLALWLRRRRRVSVFVIPFVSAWHRPGSGRNGRWAAAAGLVACILLIAALARPQRIQDRREVKSLGYDIILAIDLSRSMLTQDYIRDRTLINRLEAVRPVISAFIQRRTSDRIGLVAFSGRAYTLSPLTFDHNWLARQAARLEIGLIEDGTAIGDGLGVALARLGQPARTEAGQRKGAFIILLTDGANNRGVLPPMQAASLARARGVPVYTIGAGRMGLGSDLDEGMLRDIARETGGDFFRADDVATIERAFAAIDRARKLEFEAQVFYQTTELFPWFAGPALLLLAATAGLFAWRRPSTEVLPA